jgi:hypothetical protein
MSNRSKVGALVAIAGVVSACGDCDRAERISDQILDEWKGDQSKFDPGTRPCALPSNAAEIIGADRVHEYENACAQYADAADGC